jgi:hypothetical protein
VAAVRIAGKGYQYLRALEGPYESLEINPAHGFACLSRVIKYPLRH